MKDKRLSIIKSHFLDSGAFTLWSKSIEYSKKNNCNRWSYYNTNEFWEYVNNYAFFIKKYKIAIDLYANVDVIGNPKLTWRNQRYLEKQHKLNPVPVIHYPTNVKWLKHYIKNGYKIIGLGGLAKSIHGKGTLPWLDECFGIICNTTNRLPKVRIHGFGISSIKLWLRYPWWSIDSTSIHKKSGYGWILVPFYRKGKFVFNLPPLHISTSEKSPLIKRKGGHLFTLTNKEIIIIKKWLQYIKIPWGSSSQKGVINDGTMRKLALYYYYENMTLSLPKWPWPFLHKTTRRKLL
jgi:hypothetical protein